MKRATTAMPLRNTCMRVVGRLIEVRHDAGYHVPSDIDALMAQLKLLLVGHSPEDPVVLVADWRQCSHLVLGTTLADRLLGVLNRMNPYTLRSAGLVRADMPTAVMQLTRIVIEAQMQMRRLFTSPNDVSDWLREVTTPEEQARLEIFLARGNRAA